MLTHGQRTRCCSRWEQVPRHLHHIAQRDAGLSVASLQAQSNFCPQTGLKSQTRLLLTGCASAIRRKRLFPGCPQHPVGEQVLVVAPTGRHIPAPTSCSLQLRRVSVVWGSNTFVGFCSLGFFSMHGLTEVKPRRLGLALRHQWLVPSMSPTECPWRKAALAGQEMHNQVCLGRSSELTHVGQRRRMDQGRKCKGTVYRLLL